MPKDRRTWLRRLLAGLALTCLPAAAPSAEPAAPTLEFNRDIRPILSDNCYACHGPDQNQRKADLRLDLQEGALNGRIIVPGKPDESELYLRITAADPAQRMPPRKSEKRLTAEQIAQIRRWIEQGARWQDHWSRLAPKRPPVPAVSDPAWPVNPIDHFILARLDREKLRPSPEADKRTLIRRLSFDLTGLPPTPEEVDAFLADNSPEAYEKVVDRLLASPHYGERMALYWLDLVRFADTGGYHSDNHRDLAPYRDYVIKAFNDNMRFDRFTVEQLAGDLLPSPTVEHKIASGYNRLLMTTEEGGAQPKEYMAKYLADRVRNVSTVWLALTMGCAECHHHKFDPISMKDFYSLGAFFADIQEKAVGRQEQTLLPSPEQEARLKMLDAQMVPLHQAMAAPEVEAAQAKWEEAVRKGEVKGLPKPIADIVALAPAKRNEKQRQALAAHYRSIAPELEPVRRQLAELQRRKDEILRDVPSTLITRAGPPRVVRILPRGNWLDESGELVQPDTPAALPPLGVKDRRATRLDLARWLVSDDNPLTARVFVNRLWMLLFGQGLVKTLDDFGSQGSPPSHPELLDWLAVEFRESGWDVKHLVKRMVMSRTYRQSSQADEALRKRDPYNVLLARQGRFRLDAEMVRDNALAVSGLLSRKIGGRSVKPYQPDGYWAFLNFPKREYVKDTGEDLYRRGLYTYWQRTFPHPSLLAFDAPSREECTVERPRSNTPLQALVLLNDPTYVEAARCLAERIVREAGSGTEARIQFAYRQVLCRKAEPAEVNLLAALAEQHLQKYRVERESAQALLKVGDRPAPKEIDPAELAAWTSVARVLLNLHETITRN
ncbi:MAG TPA: PSD1 and planctomycete cytochrome C domain-containing protein [Gemmataceae bacterium]|nr:PSD1 and planctomycete cytochrome C domain-containing protein [Gemmataceae bacterium]